MSRAPPEVPAVIRNKALAAGAARWIGDLPEFAVSLERDWPMAADGRSSTDREQGTSGQLDARGEELKDR